MLLTLGRRRPTLVRSSRGEVKCLDTEGFHDGENDGPFTDEVTENSEADVVWVLNMMTTLGVSQHTGALACHRIR